MKRGGKIVKKKLWKVGKTLFQFSTNMNPRRLDHMEYNLRADQLNIGYWNFTSIQRVVALNINLMSVSLWYWYTKQYCRRVSLKWSSLLGCVRKSKFRLELIAKKVEHYGRVRFEETSDLSTSLANFNGTFRNFGCQTCVLQCTVNNCNAL